MPEVGIRELKAHASEIVRDVRDHRAPYTVTYHGRPVGILLPFSEPNEAGPESPWSELERLGREISRGWRSPISSTELLSQMRR